MIAVAAIVSLVIANSPHRHAAPLSELPGATGEAPTAVIPGASLETAKPQFGVSPDAAVDSAELTKQLVSHSYPGASGANRLDPSTPTPSARASDATDMTAEEAPGHPVVLPNTYHYVEVDLSRCQRLSNKDESDIIQECSQPYLAGIYLVTHIPEPRSWIDIEMGETVWTTENVVVYDPQNQFGQFPNASGVADLVIDDLANKPVAFIFPVEAQSVADWTRTELQYFVLYLGTGKHPCFRGRSASRDGARALVWKDVVCKPLERRATYRPGGFHGNSR